MRHVRRNTNRRVLRAGCPVFLGALALLLAAGSALGQCSGSFTSPLSDITACAGVTTTIDEQVSFGFPASGSVTTHTFAERSFDGGATFQVAAERTDNWFPGAFITTTLSYDATFTASDNGTLLRNRIEMDCGPTFTSNAVRITVNSAPAITTEPSSQSVCAGASVALTAAAGGTPTPMAQWQVSTDGGRSFSDIPQATDQSLTFTAGAGDSGKQYRAVFTNGCGSATTSPATLMVTTPVAPSFAACPGDLQVSTDPGQCSASVSLTLNPTGTPAPTVIYQVNGTPISSPYRFPAGATAVVCTASNCAGTATCRFAVTVVDTEKPAVTAPGDISVSTDDGRCTASNVALGTPTTNDNCGVASVTNNAPATFPLGDTTVNWTVTDVNGNTNTAAQTVHVSPPPLSFIPGPGSANSGAGAGKAQLFLTDAGKCSATLTLTPPATAGGCGMVTVKGTRLDGSELSDPYPVGPTKVTWTAVDSQGSQVTSEQVVMVVDREKPAFSKCPSTPIRATATCTAGGAGALVSFSALSATDNCTGTPTINYDHQSGSFFPPGDTTVMATAMDAAANSATCAFAVSVTYACSGFLPPINATGGSVFKAGSTVPVIFQLTGPSACIITLAATFSYSKVSKGGAGAVNAAGSTSAATSGNQFRYTGGQYIYDWNTKGLTAGTYQLWINLGDGVTYTATIDLK